ncbi:TCEAL8 isoform 1, partial [Pan troglodytes]
MQKSCEENEGKPQNMPKAEEDRPLEDVPQEDTPVRHLDPEEMIRGVDELERLREEIRRVRNKFVMMHWKQRHSR